MRACWEQFLFQFFFASSFRHAYAWWKAQWPENQFFVREVLKKVHHEKVAFLLWSMRFFSHEGQPDPRCPSYDEFKKVLEDNEVEKIPTKVKIVLQEKFLVSIALLLAFATALIQRKCAQANKTAFLHFVPFFNEKISFFHFLFLSLSLFRSAATDAVQELKSHWKTHTASTGTVFVWVMEDHSVNTVRITRRAKITSKF